MQNFDKALEMINEKVDNHKIKYISMNQKLFTLPKERKIEIIQKKLKEYEELKSYLIEANNPKNDYAIQQYAILTLKMKNWIIAEQMK